MTTIITVHGTSAGEEGDAGDHWWREGSPFQTRLAELIEAPDGRLEFVSFLWSGRNSERARRRAGTALARRIAQEKEPPVVIGHSHGGSVAIHALFDFYARAPRKALTAFRALVTVGTPMFRFRADWNPLFRFNIIGQLFMVYAALIATLVFAGLFYPTDPAIESFVGWTLLEPFLASIGAGETVRSVARLATPGFLFAAILPAIVLLNLARNSIRRNQAFGRNVLIEKLEGAYAALNHSLDEAFAATKTAIRLNVRLVDADTVHSAIFPLFAFVFAGVFTIRAVSESLVIRAPAAEAPGVLALSDLEAVEEPLALRPARSAAYASRMIFGGSGGEIRSSIAEPGRILTQKTAFLRSDYVVLDLATAFAMRTREDLAVYLEGLGPTAEARSLDPHGKPCTRAAIYMTEAARGALVQAARALPPRAYPAPREAAGNGEACSRGEVADHALEATPMGDLIRAGALERAAAGIMTSTRRKSADELLFEVDRPHVFPALRRGEAIVFERSFINDVQMRCLLSDAWTLARPLVFWTNNEPLRLTLADGFCAQIESADFNYFYDSSTTALGAIEDLLQSVLNDLGFQLERLLAGNRARGAVREILESDEVSAGLTKPLLFIASVLILAWTTAAALSLVLAPALSAIFNGLLKRRIFGNDGHGEDVVQVAPGLDFSAPWIGTLPARVEEDICEYVQQYAPETIRRVREIVSLAAEADGELPISAIGEHLTWKELIHTSYFDVDSFVKFVAATLIAKGVARPSAAFEADPDFGPLMGTTSAMRFRLAA